MAIQAGTARPTPSPDRRLPGHRAGHGAQDARQTRGHRRDPYMLCRYAAGWSILRPLKDGYYLVLSLPVDGRVGGGHPPLGAHPGEAQPGAVMAESSPTASARGWSGPGTSSTRTSRTSCAAAARSSRRTSTRSRRRSSPPTSACPRRGRPWRCCARGARRSGGRRGGDARAAARRDPLHPRRGRSAVDALRGAGRGSSSWSASTAWARPPRSASWPPPGRRRAARRCSAPADTFRAAAAEQLAIWAQRAGVASSTAGPGADPAAVADRRAAAPRKARGTTPCSSTPPAACTPRAT